MHVPFPPASMLTAKLTPSASFHHASKLCVERTPFVYLPPTQWHWPTHWHDVLHTGSATSHPATRPTRIGHIAEMAASHFLQVQVKSQVISLQVQVKSQVISVQVQVKSQVISVQVQVKSQVNWSDVKSSHKSFGPNTSQVTSLFVQVQVKSHIISSTSVIRRRI